MSTEIVRLRRAIDAALHELGVPNDNYPAPVANAVTLLQAALNAEDTPLPDHLAALERAGGGDWTNETPEWQAAAARWRDECWHAALAPLAELASLPANWDSYGAPAISPAAVAYVRLFLDALHLVPTSAGGISMEWHGLADLSLDVDVRPDGTVEGVWVEHNGYEIGTDETPPHVGVVPASPSGTEE
jgi:hypothetical protein